MWTLFGHKKQEMLWLRSLCLNLETSEQYSWLISGVQSQKEIVSKIVLLLSPVKQSSHNPFLSPSVS